MKEIKKLSINIISKPLHFMTNYFFFFTTFTIYLQVFDIRCKKRGMYGSNCEVPCLGNCNDNSCHIQNGKCIQCKTGWLGMYCDIGIIIYYLWWYEFCKGCIRMLLWKEFIELNRVKQQPSCVWFALNLIINIEVVEKTSLPLG